MNVLFTTKMFKPLMRQTNCCAVYPVRADCWEVKGGWGREGTVYWYDERRGSEAEPGGDLKLCY